MLAINDVVKFKLPRHSIPFPGWRPDDLFRVIQITHSLDTYLLERYPRKIRLGKPENVGWWSKDDITYVSKAQDKRITKLKKSNEIFRV